MRKFLKGIAGIFRANKGESIEIVEDIYLNELEFREKVKQILIGKKDYCFLFDKSLNKEMDSKTEREYIKNMTKKFIEERNNILNCGL